MLAEESFLDFKCPYCGEMVSFPQEASGSVETCPTCNESLIVPEPGSETGHAIPLPITTTRLTLRRLRNSDWQDLMQLMAEEELFRYIEGGGLSEEQILDWLNRDAHVKFTTPDQIVWLAMELQESGKLIGYVSLQPSHQCRQAVVSLCLTQSCQRKGLALEALQAVLSFCFQGLKLHRLSAWCDSRNAPALKLLEKAGLRREGEFVKDRFFNGEWVNTIWYALLRDEVSK
jgi:RimJ/RimL family protein N-acetyltransferase